MRAIVHIVCAAALALAWPAAARAQDKKPAPDNVEGYWLGPLKTDAIDLRIGLKIERKDGVLRAKIDSPDQSAFGLPVDEVTIKDGKFRLEAKKLASVYEATLSKDGSELQGEWRQGGATMPLTLKRLEKEPSYARPQDPKRPYPYRDEEVAYENRKAGVKFGGTLTLPKGDGPFPAVLLITGSGPQDRDESLLGHRPFLVIADHLTRKGIAVLRVDDRGVGKSTGDTMKSTTADFADDALAGVEYLKGRKEINPKQIGLIGHSEGGLVAPLAASRSGDVAFIVLLAGPGLVGEEILYLQGQLIARAMGKGEKDLADSKRVQQLLFAAIKAEKDEKKAAEQIERLLKEEVDKLPEEKKKEAAAGLKGQLGMLQAPWFRYFLTYDPAPALRATQCPVLAIFGEKDLQVPPRENIAALEKALKEGGNRDYTVREFPGLNHLFQTCKTGAPTEYGVIEETIAPVVLTAMSEWILKRYPPAAK